MTCSKFSKHTIDLNNSGKSECDLKSDSGVVLIGERSFPLNKSKSKSISISLSRDYGYMPCVKLSGNKGVAIIFNEDEWTKFMSYQGIITNYLYSNETIEPIQTDKFSIYFEQLSFSRVVRIWKNQTYIYLGYESICKLWDLEKIIQFRIDILKKQQFLNYYKVLQSGLSGSGDIITHASKIIYDSFPTENVCLVLELLHLYPKVFEADCS